MLANSMSFSHNRRDLLLLVLAALVLLALPNRDMGPLLAFNPYRTWLVVVLLLGMNAIGLLLSSLIGTRHSLPVTAFASGFVSSTATILALGLYVRKHPGLHAAAVAGAVLSSIATYLQMALLLTALSPLLARHLLPAMLAGTLVSAIYSIAFIRRSARVPQDVLPAGHPAVSFHAALTLALLIAAINMGVIALHKWLGEQGIWLAGALAGLSDAHAAGASMASLVSHGSIAAEAAIVPVMLGLTSNTLLRMVLAASAGSRAYALEVLPGLALGLLAAWAGALPAVL